METPKRIKTALISVYYKEGLENILNLLDGLGVKIYSTGVTFDFIQSLNIKATTVESLTSYPSILGGRVKTLHPLVFGGILGRRDHISDLDQLKQFGIPEIDLVVVDLYPFEETLSNTDNEEDIIEKIDIGGISLIRAAAKNFRDVVVIPSRDHYDELTDILINQQGISSLDDRKRLAAKAFHVSSHYDTMIFSYLNRNQGQRIFKKSLDKPSLLRYGENPHQEGLFYGATDQVFEKLNGKDISFNNLVDIDAALSLIHDFDEATFAILKHTNACGIASRPKLADAWADALAADPVSAFGGVLVTNAPIDEATSQEINKLFFEVLMAPTFEKNALELLKSRKNRILLQVHPFEFPGKCFKSLLNGIVEQDRDNRTEGLPDLKVVTKLGPNTQEIKDLLFANKVVKHTKSNAIVLAKNMQMLASGVGQTSRVDALKQAIAKAKDFGFDLKGAVMASDAFFPFSDCVEIACQEGIQAIIQPGGSVRDNESVNFCNEHQMSMVFTGIRHFKH